MRYWLPGFVIVLVLGLSAAQAEDTARLQEVIKKKVEKLNDAVIKEEFEDVVDLTHANIVKLIGGRKKMIATLENGAKDMKSKGYSIKSVKVDDPSEAVAKGAELYAVVPFLIEMKAPGGKLFQKSFVIGVSDDQGKSWTFVNGDVDIKQVKQVLPNLPEELKIPEKKKPVFEKD